MNYENFPRLPSQCAYSECQSKSTSLTPGHFVRKGFYFRSSDGRSIPRFSCLVCKRSFSSASFSNCFGQKKRRLNDQIFKLLVSGVSQRRAAKILGTTRGTVVRKFLFLAVRARASHQTFLKEFIEKRGKLNEVVFDEMESFEKSKCLPVSIPLAVDPKTRKVLGFGVCSMPAKGPLAKISVQKYGPREDHRTPTALSL